MARATEFTRPCPRPVAADEAAIQSLPPLRALVASLALALPMAAVQAQGVPLPPCTGFPGETPGVTCDGGGGGGPGAPSGPGAVVTAVTVPAAGMYRLNDTLEIRLAWDRPVAVMPTPRIALTIGSQTVYASFVGSASSSTSSVFRATLAAGLTDADGIAIGALELNGGDIFNNSDHVAAVLDFSSVLPSTTTVLVDSADPVITSLAASAPTQTGATLVLGTSESLTVHWIVVASGAPAPTVQQVLDHVAYGGTTVVAHGNATVAAGGTTPVAGLTAGTAYRVYAVAVDGAGNRVASVASAALTTASTAPPPPPPPPIPSGGSVNAPSGGTVTAPSNGSGTVNVNGTANVVSSDGTRLTVSTGNGSTQPVQVATVPASTQGGASTPGGAAVVSSNTPVTVASGSGGVPLATNGDTVVRTNTTGGSATVSTGANGSTNVTASGGINLSPGSNRAVVVVASPIASAQTASIISTAISGGFTSGGGIGGGFSAGGSGGGFSPSGGSSSATIIPPQSTTVITTNTGAMGVAVVSTQGGASSSSATLDLRPSSNGQVMVLVDPGQNNTVVIGYSSNANLSIIAGVGADTVLGGAGNDTIIGGVGSDTVLGGARNDSITAGTNGLAVSSGKVREEDSFKLGDVPWFTFPRMPVSGPVTVSPGTGGVTVSSGQKTARTLDPLSSYTQAARNTVAPASFSLKAGETLLPLGDGSSALLVGSGKLGLGWTGDALPNTGIATWASTTIYRPQLDGTVPRLGGRNLRTALEQGLAQAGATREGAVDDQGGFSLRSNGGTRQHWMPVGPVAVNLQPAADGVAAGAGRMQAVTVGGVVVNLAPALTAPAELGALAKAAGASLSLRADGSYLMYLGGQSFAFQPEPEVTAGSTRGLGADAQGRLQFTSSRMEQQALQPAVADLDQTLATLRTLTPDASLVGTGQGRYRLKVLGGQWTVVPDMALVPAPVSSTGQAWWVGADAKIYFRLGGLLSTAAQGFSVLAAP